jgi:hypothetical protein
MSLSWAIWAFTACVLVQWEYVSSHSSCIGPLHRLSCMQRRQRSTAWQGGEGPCLLSWVGANTACVLVQWELLSSHSYGIPCHRQAVYLLGSTYRSHWTIKGYGCGDTYPDGPSSGPMRWAKPWDAVWSQVISRGPSMMYPLRVASWPTQGNKQTWPGK